MIKGCDIKNGRVDSSIVTSKSGAKVYNQVNKESRKTQFKKRGPSQFLYSFTVLDYCHCPSHCPYLCL